MSELLFEKTFVKYHTNIYKNFNDIIHHDEVSDLSDDFGVPHVSIKKTLNPFTLLNELNQEKDFVENYVNPFAGVFKMITTIKIERNDDKLVIKIFDYCRNRRVGSKFFKVRTYLKYFGVNIKSGDVYSGYILNYHKKRKFSKKIFINNFYVSPCNEVKTYIRSVVRNYFNTEDMNQPSDITNNVFNIFLENLNIKKDTFNNLSDDDLIFKYYLDFNKIKYPNNFKVFRNVYPSPKKAELKKFKNKYIDCFMSIHNLNGDKVKRILHTVDSFHPYSLDHAYKLFGKDYIMSQEDSIIKDIIETSFFYNSDLDRFFLSKNQKDKQNAFKIFKIFLNEDINLNTFIDHIIFYNRLKILERIKWKSNDYGSFLEEHIIWSEKINQYDNGNFTRIYSDEFKNSIEPPILTKEGPVFVKLLTNSNEYNSESLIQSNCVKTYIKRENSVIISLRRGDNDSKDRATIEYRITHNGDNVIKLIRVQSLGRFNNKLDETWDCVLDILDDRVDKLVNKKQFELPSATLEVGDKKFQTKLVAYENTNVKYIDINGNSKFYSLKWDEPVIIQSDSNEYFIFDLFF